MNFCNHNLSRATTSFGLFALLCACTSTPRGTYNSLSGKEGGAEVSRVSPNRELENSLEMKNIVQVRKEGMLVVQLDLANRLDRALAFQWAIEWYDRAGLVLDYGPAHYRPERLSGRQSKTIKVVAPSPEAESWKLQVGSRDEAR